MVVIPLLQQDHANSDLLIDFNYTKMSGRQFISSFINDPALQHCSSYGLKRVSFIKQVDALQNLHLINYGLDDLFGIDINLILRLATVGNVDFEQRAHIKRSVMGGSTERYPLTFAYTYYQYAKYAIRFLKKKNIIKSIDARSYIKFWLLLILRGLVVSYRPVHGVELEKGTQRICKHLKIPINLYLLLELMKHRIKPSDEMLMLFRLSIKLRLESNVS